MRMIFRTTGYLLAGLMLMSIFAFSVFAQTPQINYQGKITDNTGLAVADGDYDVTFALYTVASGGSAVWTEARTGGNQVTVTNGLFSVMLGEVATLSGVDFTDTLYLGVNFDSDGEMTPRKLLGTVPAAFEAQNAQTLDNIATSSFLRSDQADDISATEASTLLTITQSGTGDILNLFDGGTEVFTVIDGGNIGIGTDNPSSMLTLGSAGALGWDDGLGTSDISLRRHSAGTLLSSGDLAFGDLDGTGADLTISAGGTGGNRKASISQNGNSPLTIYANGGIALTGSNVGIGTTSPTERLTVAGGGLFEDTLYVAQGALGTGGISFAGDTDTGIYRSLGNQIRLNAGGVDAASFGQTSALFYSNASIDNDGNFDGSSYYSADDSVSASVANFHLSSAGGGLYTPATNELALSTNATERLRIDASGNVGIGTSSPLAKFQVDTSGNSVSGVVVSNPTSGTLAGARVLISAASNNSTLAGLQNSGLSLNNYNSSYTGTLFGITRANYSSITTGSTGAGLLVGTFASSPVVFGTANAERMRIDASGNVGIGTTTSSQKLTVGGSGYFTDSVSIGTSSVSDSGTKLALNGGRLDILASDPVGVGSVRDGSGGTDGMNGATAVKVVGKYAYVTSYLDNALQIIDISDPANPVGMGSIADGENGANNMAVAYGLDVVGSYAYVAGYSDDALQIIDISDPTNPVGVGSIVDGEKGALRLNGPRSVEVSGNYAYVTSYFDNGLEVIDISDPTNPVSVGSIGDSVGAPELQSAIDVVVRGKYAYVIAYNDDGLQIIDISDPTSPVGVGSVTDGASGTDSLGGAYSIAVRGNYAYIASDDDNAVQIIDISDPANPTGVGSIVDGTNNANDLAGPRGIALAGNYAYVAAYDERSVQVLDISDPTNPVGVGSALDAGATDALNGPNDVQIYGNLAYVTSYSDDALQVLDIGGMRTPSSELGSLFADRIDTENFFGGEATFNNLNVGQNALIGGGLTITGTASSTLQSGNTNPALTVLSGNVGIGTSTPSQKLTVAGNISATGQIFVGDGSATNPSVTFGSDSNTGIYKSSNDYLGFSAAGTLAMEVNSSVVVVYPDLALSAGGLFDKNTSLGSAGMVLQSTGSQVEWVATSSLGIGGSVAADSLNFTEFADSLLLDASTDIAINNTNVFSLTNTGTGNSFVVNDQSGDSSPFVIDASGDVGIRTTDTSWPLNVVTNGGAVAKFQTTDYPSSGSAFLIRMGASTGNTYSSLSSVTSGGFGNGNIVLNESGGNVGIGTTTPSQKLVVNGDSLFTSNVGIGAVAVSGVLDVHRDSANTSSQLVLRDEDVNHGMTVLGATDAVLVMGSGSPANGGGFLRGLSDNAGTPGLLFDGVIGSASPSASAMTFQAGKKNGTLSQALSANETAFTFSNFATDLVSIMGSGNVGIGTTTPGSLFTVGGGDSFQVNSTGQVGIGGVPYSSYSLRVTDSIYAGFEAGESLEIWHDQGSGNKVGIDSYIYGFNNSTGYENIIDQDSSTAATTEGINTEVYNFSSLSSGTDYTYGLRTYVQKVGQTGGTAYLYGSHIELDSDSAGAGTSYAYGSYIDTGVSAIANADNTYGQYITTEANSGTIAYGLYVDAGIGAGTEYAAAFMNGNVGIGTTSPYAKLSVDGDIAFTGGIYDSTASLGTNGMVLQTDGTSATWVATSSLGISGGGLSSSDIDTSAELAAILTDETGSGAAVFATAPTFTGTATFNNVRASTYRGIANLDATLRGDTDVTIHIDDDNDGSNTFSVLDGGDNSLLTILESGNVGIGTTTPSSKLDVSGFINSSSGYRINGQLLAYASTTNQSTIFGVGAGGSTALTSPTYTGATAIGYNALSSNTTGSENTAVGWSALTTNSTGNNNTAIGSEALYSNTTGSANIALGPFTLRSNATGTNNAAIGLYSMYYNTSGSNNTAVGPNALVENTEGYNNVSIGTYSLYNNSLGNTNTAIGSQALYQNLEGVGNVGLGYQALYSNTYGDNNTGLGSYALANTTGSNNIAIGMYAGFNLTTGSNNLIIGHEIDAPSATASNQLSIGNLIYGTGLTATGTTLSSGNIGIGTSTPSSRFVIQSASTTNPWDFSVGESAVNLGLGDFMMPSLNGFSEDSPTYGRIQGVALEGDLFFANPLAPAALSVMGMNAVTGNLALNSYNDFLIDSVTGTGNVGIGTSTPTHKLTVAGNASFTGTANFVDADITGRLDLGSDSYINNVGFVRLVSGNEGGPAFSFNNDADTGMWNAQANTLAFSTGGTQRMEIDAAGNVGIGTTTPTERLTVAGGGLFEDTVYLAQGSLGTGGISFAGDTDTGLQRNGDDIFAAYAGGVFAAYFSTFDVGFFDGDTSIFSNGQISVKSSFGAATPGYTFQSDSDTGMYRSGANELSFSTNGTQRLRISSSGTVFATGDIESGLVQIDNGGSIYLDSYARIDADYSYISAGNFSLGTTSTPYQLTVDGDTYLTGSLIDSTHSSGTPGMVLQTTGAGTQWVATSSLGIGGSAGDFQSDGSVPMSDTLFLAQGALGTGGLYFAGDTNTGISRQNADQLDFEAGGANVLQLYSDAVYATENLHVIGSSLILDDDRAGYAGSFINYGNAVSRQGLLVQAGLYDPAVVDTSTLIQFNDGDGGALGSIDFGNEYGGQSLQINPAAGSGLELVYGALQLSTTNIDAFAALNAYAGFTSYEDINIQTAGASSARLSLFGDRDNDSGDAGETVTQIAMRSDNNSDGFNISMTNLSSANDLIFTHVLSGTPSDLFAFRSNGRFGIGTNEPDELLEVASGNMLVSGGGVIVTNTGASPAVLSLRGDSDDDSGDAGETVTQIEMRSDDNSDGFNIQMTNGSSANDLIFTSIDSGTPTDLFTFRSSGRFGIGTTTPAQKLQVYGDIRVGTTGTNGCLEDYGGTAIAGTCSSDAELKTDIRPIAGENTQGFMERMAEIEIVTYKWNQTANSLYSKNTDIDNLGVIAQNVEEVFPELVSRDSEGYRQVDFRAFPFYMIEAMKEIWEKITGLEEKVEEIDDLKKRIEALEAQSGTQPSQYQEPEPESDSETVDEETDDSSENNSLEIESDDQNSPEEAPVDETVDTESSDEESNKIENTEEEVEEVSADNEEADEITNTEEPEETTDNEINDEANI